MQATEDNIKTLVFYLGETIQPDPVKRKQAENYLNSISGQPGFCVILLKLQEVQTIDINTRLAAALFFKNIVKAHWIPRDDGLQISDSDRAQIKGVLVNLMLSVPDRIQNVISDALSIISESDFPANWPSLLPELVNKFEIKDWSIINGVLKTAHSIFRRYRHQFKTESVLAELKFILENFEKPFLDLFVTTGQVIDANVGSSEVLNTLFITVKLLSKIFYSLNSIDLPEYFEDNMEVFMNQFRKYLHFQSNSPILLSEDEDKPGLIHKVQAQICENINLYIEKYEEEFAKFLPAFVQDVWTLLAKTGLERKYDQLVNSSIRFLTSVAKSVHHTLFREESILKMICMNIVIPNMRLRDTDEELFEDNPVEYIRRDVEGSDTDTRRRAALELVKGLRKHYEAAVTQLFSSDINSMLALYSSDPKKNWKAKDTAIYLVTALAVQSITAASGTTTTNQLVPIVDFFNSQISPELQIPIPVHPILKADALKFIITFRYQLPREVCSSIFPNLINSLADSNYVVHTYAASCIERLLTVKDQDKKPRFNTDIKSFLGNLLQNLFVALLRSPSDAGNEYIMKAIMRVIATTGEDIAPFASECMTKLVAILGAVCKNPTNPSFNHFLFETLAAIIRSACTPNRAAIIPLEGFLFPVFQTILQLDVVEFAPYVFQLLSLMIELSPVPISQAYLSIFQPLLSHVLWERSGNIPALVRLLQAFTRKSPSVITSGNHLTAVLGIFQKLIASSMNDHEGFYILESIVEYLKLEEFDNYLSTIFTLIFTRLTHNKTIKFIKSLLIFLSLFVAKHGPSIVIKKIDALQPRLFAMVLESLWIPNVGKVNGVIERKMCCMAMTKLLTECPETLTEYFALWPRILIAILAVIELPEDEGAPTDMTEEYADVDITGGVSPAYTGSYSHLIYASKQDVDPFPRIDPKTFLAHSLHNLSLQHPGKIVQVVQANIPPEALAALTAYFKLAAIPEPYLH
jgi:exportin-2 (importin alpha re-exporter)